MRSEPYDSIYEGKRQEAMDTWYDENLDDFNKAINDFLHPDFNTAFRIEMSASLAFNFIQTGECEFFKYYALNEANAYCFLNGHTNGKYNDELDAEFKDYLND